MLSIDSQQMDLQSKINSFQLEDEKEWLKQLHQKGVVVIRSALNKEEVKEATRLFWEWLQALESGIKMNDPATWNDQNWPGSSGVGFFVSYGGCHTQASWFIRTNLRIKEAFSKIWNTSSLISSFDTFICWRPWWNKLSKQQWDPFVQNLHVDQNPSKKRGFHCVQGMVPLIDVTSDGAGGLQVVSSTNNDKTQLQLTQRYSYTKGNDSDWVQLSNNDPFIGKGRLIQCKAGDLILFDSRTIHGGMINNPSQEFQFLNENKLVRLAMTVTMVPRSLQSQLNKQKRLDAFHQRIGLNHWPQQFHKSGFGTVASNIKRHLIKYQWPTLTPAIQELI